MSIRRRLKRLRNRTLPEDPPAGSRRVCIATPVGDLVHSAYCGSLVQMMMRTLAGKDLPAGLSELSINLYSCSILPASRQHFARFCLENDFTDLLMIDSDMSFPTDLLFRLLRHEQPVIAANCSSRKPPFRNTAQSAPGIEIPTHRSSTGLEKVYRVGTGLMWVDVDVFRRISEPWFDFDWQAEGKTFLGEDYYFCAKLREAGIPIHIDHDLSKEVQHVGTFGYSPLHVEAKHELETRVGLVSPSRTAKIEDGIALIQENAA